MLLEATRQFDAASDHRGRARRSDGPNGSRRAREDGRSRSRRFADSVPRRRSQSAGCWTASAGRIYGRSRREFDHIAGRASRVSSRARAPVRLRAAHGVRRAYVGFIGVAFRERGPVSPSGSSSHRTRTTGDARDRAEAPRLSRPRTPPCSRSATGSARRSTTGSPRVSPASSCSSAPPRSTWAVRAGRRCRIFSAASARLARDGLSEARRSVLALKPDQGRVGGLELALRQLAERSTIAGRVACTFDGGIASARPAPGAPARAPAHRAGSRDQCRAPRAFQEYPHRPGRGIRGLDTDGDRRRPGHGGRARALRAAGLRARQHARARGDDRRALRNPEQGRPRHAGHRAPAAAARRSERRRAQDPRDPRGRSSGGPRRARRDRQPAARHGSRRAKPATAKKRSSCTSGTGPT